MPNLHLVCASYKYDEFSVMVRRSWASWFGQLFGRFFGPMMYVAIEFKEGLRPCVDCYAGIEVDLQNLFGDDCLSPPHSKDLDDFDDRDWLIELELRDPGRSISYDPDLIKVVQVVRERLDDCYAGRHYILDFDTSAEARKE